MPFIIVLCFLIGFVAVFFFQHPLITLIKLVKIAGFVMLLCGIAALFMPYASGGVPCIIAGALMYGVPKALGL